MTGDPAKKFHGVVIGPLSKILAVKDPCITSMGGVRKMAIFADVHYYLFMLT